MFVIKLEYILKILNRPVKMQKERQKMYALISAF
jgi:hypothetical protein